MRRTEPPLTPLSEPGTASLLRWVAIVSLIIGIMMLAINLSQGLGMRPGAPILAALGLILLLLLRLGHLRLATWTLCLGGWFSSLMASYGTLGLLSMNWLTMPLIIMIGGWLLGRVSALILSLLSLAAVAGMYLLHLSGHEFPPILCPGDGSHRSGRHPDRFRPGGRQSGWCISTPTNPFE